MDARIKTSRHMFALALTSTAMAASTPAWAQADGSGVTFEEREVIQDISGSPVREIEIERQEMAGSDDGAYEGDHVLQPMDNPAHHPMRHHPEGHGQITPVAYPGAPQPGMIYPRAMYPAQAVGAPVYFPQVGYPAGAMPYPGGARQDGLAREEWLEECRARYDSNGWDSNGWDSNGRGKTRGRTLGALLGAAAGGLAGNRIAGRGNRLAGTLAGAGVGGLAGAVAGSAIGGSSDRREALDECEDFLMQHEARWQQMSYGYGPVMLVPIMVPVEQRAVVREYVTEEWVEEQVMVKVPGKKIIKLAPAPRPVKTVPVKAKTIKSVKSVKGS